MTTRAKILIPLLAVIIVGAIAFQTLKGPTPPQLDAEARSVLQASPSAIRSVTLLPFYTNPAVDQRINLVPMNTPITNRQDIARLWAALAQFTVPRIDHPSAIWKCHVECETDGGPRRFSVSKTSDHGTLIWFNGDYRSDALGAVLEQITGWKNTWGVEHHPEPYR